MLNSGTTIRNYKIVLELKQGAQGFVYVVEDVETHNHFVLKLLMIEDSKRVEFEKMIENWKRFCESIAKDYFVTYKEHFIEGKNTIVIMEYCVDGDLETLIKKRFIDKRKFTEDEIMKVLIDGMSGLNEMHGKECIHQDIKAANMLIGKSGLYKLCDFNASRSVNLMIGKTVTGTPEYAAPEVVNAEEYSYPVDIFSLGAVLYQMIMGKTPFANERGVVMKNLLTGKYEHIPASLGYSEHLVNIIHACLLVEPSARPTATSVLNLPFVMQNQLSLRTQMHMDALEARVRKAEGEAKEVKAQLVETVGRCVVAEREAKEAKMMASVAEKEAKEARGKASVAEREAIEAKSRLAMAEEKIANEEKKTKAIGEVLKGIVSEVESLRKGHLPDSFSLSVVTLPVQLMANLLNSNAVSIKIEPFQCTWIKYASFWGILDKQIDHGIFNIVLNCAGCTDSFGCGVVSKSRINDYDGYSDIWGERDTGIINDMYVYCGDKSKVDGKFYSGENVNVEVELNADVHTVHFSVENRPVPHCITHIPRGVHFVFFNSYKDVTVTVRRFQKLASSSISKTVKFAELQW